MPVWKLDRFGRSAPGALRAAAAAVQAGSSARAAAKEHGVALSTLRGYLARGAA